MPPRPKGGRLTASAARAFAAACGPPLPLPPRPRTAQPGAAMPRRIPLFCGMPRPRSPLPPLPPPLALPRPSLGGPLHLPLPEGEEGAPALRAGWGASSFTLSFWCSAFESTRNSTACSCRGATSCSTFSTVATLTGPTFSTFTGLALSTRRMAAFSTPLPLFSSASASTGFLNGGAGGDPTCERAFWLTDTS